MPEILTESFCERCGTRYTFESSAPRKTRRLGQFKTLSKGLKNYVLSDDTSMDEAMAAARSDEERETTAQQLDAFHSTFNFCMNCRQYTCGNCWNQAEGRCLTCSPSLGRDILEAPFPSSAPFEPQPISAEAWPTTDLPPVELVIPSLSVNGASGIAAESVADEPSNGVVHPPEAEPAAVAEEDDPGAHFSFLTPAPTEAEAPIAEAPVDAPAAWTEPEPQPEAQPSAEFTDAVEAATAEVAAIEASLAEPDASAAQAPVELPADLPATLEERASTLASHTSDLIARFRPGQNIDAELAAFEAGIEATEALAADAEPVGADAVEGELVADAGLPVAEPSLPTAWPEPDPELVAAAWPEPEADAIVFAAQAEPEWPAETREPEPFVAEPEPEPVAAVAPEPEPIAAEPIPEPEPEPIAAEAPAVEPEPAAPPIAASAEPVRTDRIEQPTWRVFAPEQGAPPAGQPLETPFTPQPSPTAPLPPAATAEPQWPTRPDIQDSPSMALLANRNRSSSDALWAASTQEVLAPVTGPAAASTSVQPCSSCGLSLSATARFCRRCGTRQG